MSYEFFPSPDAAARRFAELFVPLSTEFEHGAMIYELRSHGEKSYALGPVFRGENPEKLFGIFKGRPNVMRGFIKNYLRKPLDFSGARLCGFVHSHPRHYANRPSCGDRFVCLLPGIRRAYIAPFNLAAKNNARFFDSSGAQLAQSPCFCITDYRWRKTSYGAFTATARR